MRCLVSDPKIISCFQLLVVFFCAVGSVLAGDGSGYNYPKPSIPFGEEVCPPGSNGVYPHCDHPQPQGKCATGEY